MGGMKKRTGVVQKICAAYRVMLRSEEARRRAHSMKTGESREMLKVRMMEKGGRKMLS